MKFLLMMILLLTNCTKNNKQATSTNNTNDVSNFISTQNVVRVTYDIQPELFWFDKYDITDVIENLKYSSTIFYEPKSQKFYFSTTHKISNIMYDTNNKYLEKPVISNFTIFGAKYDQGTLIYYPIVDPLMYVGSIDLTNRIYIDTNNNLYVKKLIEINTTYYIDYEDHKKELKGSLFPYLAQTDTQNKIPPRIALSNEFNEFFVIGNLRPNSDTSNPYPNGTLYLKYHD